MSQTDLNIKADVINKPAHYTDGKIEVIDYIEDKALGYHLGNVVKYISRAGKKDPSKTVEDLQKAKWYLEREISRLQGSEDVGEVALKNPPGDMADDFWENDAKKLIIILKDLPDNYGVEGRKNSIPMFYKEIIINGVKSGSLLYFRYIREPYHSYRDLEIKWKDGSKIKLVPIEK